MARIPLELFSITLPLLLLGFFLAQEYGVINSNNQGIRHDSEYIQKIRRGLDLPASCKVSHLTAFERVNYPINFSTSPIDPFDAPKLGSLNGTAGEQWAFDGTSASGRSGLLIGIYRDASYAFLGPGNLRASLDVVWDNGTTWSTVDYLAQSTVHVCEDRVIGIWASPAEDVYYAFDVSRDSKDARVQIHAREVTGTLSIHSVTPARYPDGSLFPSGTASTWNAPMLHWAEPIPAGVVDVDLTIQGTPFRWTGMGGHERWWSAKGWLEILAKWEAVRLSAGPYTLSFWQPTSRLDGLSYPSPFLTKYGTKIFSAQQNHISKTENYILYRPISAQENEHAGYEIELVSPLEGKKWWFTMEYRNQEFAFDLGRKAGGRAYVGRARGGEQDEESYDGVFFIEHVDVESLTVPRLYIILCEWYYRVKVEVLKHYSRL